LGKLKIHYNELLDAGYKQYGNWWLKDDISVNLHAHIVKHAAKPYFEVELERFKSGDITLADVESFAAIMGKLTGREA
jgi:hypothetical protein